MAGYRRWSACAVIVLVLTGALGASRLTKGDYLSHIRYLASPELQGRGNGTPGLQKAAVYMAAEFRAAGVKPIPGDSYFQDFSLTTSARLGPSSTLDFRKDPQPASHDLRLERDFVPLNLSASGSVSGPLVFAGYGITAPEYRYDDYAGLDVQGKIVLILRHEPQEFDAKSVFDGKAYTAHAQLFSKASNAKMHGAAAVLLVNDAAAHPAEENKLEKFGVTEGPDNAGIEFVQVSSGLAEDWLSVSGQNLKDIESGIDKDLRPHSFALPPTLTVAVKVDVEREVKTVHNVCAYIPGAASREYVVIGAHYDHLGLGGQYSLAPSQTGTVHPGADDNASGAAGLLELAQRFHSGPRLRRGVLFIAFAGEELGLLGSNYYVNHPELPLENAVAMINMDMIGRIRDRKVYVGGSGTGTSFPSLLQHEEGRYEIVTDLTERAGYGSSDHTSFTAKQIPTLFFSPDFTPITTVPATLGTRSTRAKRCNCSPTSAMSPVNWPTTVHGPLSSASPSRPTPIPLPLDRRKATGQTSAASPISPNSPTACVSPTFAPARPPPKPDSVPEIS